jgi:dihydrodipicolinate synthase/N-acetylneuraminate lyase
VPILIYNFPQVTRGVDLASETIIQIAAHENVVGVKLTCGNTGKLARIAAGAKPDFFVAG